MLKEHIGVSGGRFHGIRFSTAWDADERVHNTVSRPRMLAESLFREGYKCLSRFGLTFDAWVYHPQLSEVAELAAAFPDTPILLNHFGSPILGGPNAGRTEEVFAEWRASMGDARVSSKCARQTGRAPGSPRCVRGEGQAALLAGDRWGMATILRGLHRKIGARRCMFESNFPVQKRWCSYAVLWNARKHLASGASAAGKTALFAGTAARVYRLPTGLN